ncbi:MAG: DUF1015 domain-containing protein [Dehalococcoidia bacterium]|nr:MAG: DUF1015 domain-containing protein [Dehalococcoidia bacterium]
MVEIKSFKAVYYNQSMVGSLSDVICPPYDVIDPLQEEELYRRSKYNFVRIEHNRQLLQDSEVDNRYTRSGEKLKQWLEQQILITSKIPAIYIHDHFFKSQGRKYMRRGLVVRVKIEEWYRNIIRPHEGTLVEAKSDRIKLLEALRANTSPVMTLYEDKEKEISKLLESEKTNDILIRTEEENGESHEVWQIGNKQIIKGICNSFVNKILYIADGHHRYESALLYQRQMIASSALDRGDEAFNFIMMTLVDFDDPGLVILPPHRLLRGLPESKLVGLKSKLESLFDIEYLSLNTANLWQKVDGLMGDKSSLKLFLFGPEDQNLLVLTLRDVAVASRMIPYFHSEIYKGLDVSIIDHVIIEELLGLSSGDKIKISFNYDCRDAVNSVLNQEYQLAFIVSPVKAETIKKIADAGDRMPRKSTYFYPKLPSGLIINQLV